MNVKQQGKPAANPNVDRLSYLGDIPWVQFVRRPAEPGEVAEGNILYGIKTAEDIQRVIDLHFSDEPKAT